MSSVNGIGGLMENMRSGFVISYNLQLFADGPGGEKTEEATAKKLDDARKEGQVARSAELTTAVSLMGLFLSLKYFGAYVGNSFLNLFSECYNSIDGILSQDFDKNLSSSIFNLYAVKVLTIALPFLLVSFLIAFLVNIAQVGYKPTSKPLQPKFSKIDPISGFKKMFSKEKLVDLVKSIAKIAVIIILCYTTIKSTMNNIVGFYQMDTLQIAVLYICNFVVNLGIKISAFFIIIGAADFLYQKFKFRNDMKMTKQEIKDEFKNTEGDPQIKGRIKQKMREASQRRMMQNVPKADVVITNPTHFACALTYDRSVSKAPVLVAKGADYVAAKIKDIAKENKIPIVENKPLARMLYFNVDLDAEIPQELYQMTAEVLAYVYNLKNKT